MTKDELVTICNGLPFIAQVNNEETLLQLQLLEHDRANLKSKIDRLQIAIDNASNAMRRRARQAAVVDGEANTRDYRDGDFNLGFIAVDTIRDAHARHVKAWAAELKKNLRALKRVEKRIAELEKIRVPMPEFYWG